MSSMNPVPSDHVAWLTQHGFARIGRITLDGVHLDDGVPLKGKSGPNTRSSVCSPSVCIVTRS
jgi:hypothetical protein